MQNGSKTKTEMLNIVKIILGAFIFALGVNTFAISNHLGEGGVTGITMQLYYVYGWSPAVTNIILNGILITIGYKFLDKKTIYYTLLAIVSMSLFLRLTEKISFEAKEPVIGALIAGATIGLGMAVIMKGNGTTAGSAILAKLANKYLGWNTSYALLFFDLCVVLPSTWVIGFERMLLTVVSLYIGTKVLDFILEGSNPKKTITIISNHHEAIAERVAAELDRGITVLHGHGFYRKDQKQVLYIVISRQQLMPMNKIINEIDPEAFVIINDAQSVIGEGFTRQIFDE